MSNLIHLTHADLIDNNNLHRDSSLWLDPTTGTFISAPDPALSSSSSTTTINLQNRIVAPGFLDLQINGAYGFDFSSDIAHCAAAGVSYPDRLRDVRRRFIETGVTSFLPTMTSQFPGRYYQNLPYLGPSPRNPSEGAESLGAHCEGPFFAHNRVGVHDPAAVQATGSTSEPERVIETYGVENVVGTTQAKTDAKNCKEEETDTEMKKKKSKERMRGCILAQIRMITIAPERPGALDTIRQLSDAGVVMCLGHMGANYAQTQAGIRAGASMLTHLFNQMNPHHHRQPGPLGVLTAVPSHTAERRTETETELETGSTAGSIMDMADDDDDGLSSQGRPYFGLIADGCHVHPASIRLAHQLHPDGLVLVTDALLLLGGEDGTSNWGSRRLTKRGVEVKLEGTEIIAGSCVTLIQCINNFRAWTGSSIPTALRTVTSTPATVLGLQDTKGTLRAGADADFVVLSEELVSGRSVSRMVVDQVWKFGVKVFDRCEV